MHARHLLFSSKLLDETPSLYRIPMSLGIGPALLNELNKQIGFYVFIPSFRPWPGLWLFPPDPWGTQFSLLAPAKLVFLKPPESWPSDPFFLKTPSRKFIFTIFPLESACSLYKCAPKRSVVALKPFSCHLSSVQLTYFSICCMLPDVLHQRFLLSLEICSFRHPFFTTIHFLSEELLFRVILLISQQPSIARAIFSQKQFLIQLHCIMCI